MSLNESKIKIFNKVASLKTDLNSKVRKGVDTTNKFIENNEQIQFLIDLLKVLQDVNELKKTIIDTISNDIEKIEYDFKEVLKKSLNDITWCFTETKTPSNFITEGVSFKLRDIDFNSLLVNDPNSDVGKLLYFDNAAGLNSKDMNTFLYSVTTLPYAFHKWGNTSHSILEIMFSPEKDGEYDVLTVKVGVYYADAKLSKFFQDLMESIDLINTKVLLTTLTDSISGTVSVNSNKIFNNVYNEIETNDVIENIINGEEVDKAFEIAEKNKAKIETLTNNKIVGKFINNEVTQEIFGEVNINTLKGIGDQLEAANNSRDIDKILSLSLNSLGSIDMIDYLDKQDIPTINLSFIETMVKNLGVILSNTVLSPKVVIPLVLALKFSGVEEIKSAKDLIKSQPNIFKEIFSKVGAMIIGLLYEKCKKYITQLAKEKIKKIMTEKVKNRRKQLNSLL